MLSENKINMIKSEKAKSAFKMVNKCHGLLINKTTMALGLFVPISDILDYVLELECNQNETPNLCDSCFHKRICGISPSDKCILYVQNTNYLLCGQCLHFNVCRIKNSHAQTCGEFVGGG